MVHYITQHMNRDPMIIDVVPIATDVVSFSR